MLEHSCPYMSINVQIVQLRNNMDCFRVNMSWFDTTNLTSIASKAMKEAQKTLDKALDIKENEEEHKGRIIEAFLF